MNIRKATFIVFSILWMLLIFCFSAQPAVESAQMSHSVGKKIGYLFARGYGSWTQEKQDNFAQRIDYPVRKCAHAAEYAVLSLLLAGATVDTRAGKKRLMRQFALCFFFGILYAAGDEIHQLFVPGRAGRVSDVMIDGLGVLAGLLAAYFLNFFYTHTKS